ncbi:MAG: hypothetical protein A2Y48_03325 [Nitrospirae bacterium RIFCSPLOW2_12_42_9]|nr:MAG: hypothetical protein A2Y48_03325 [Nitrospirae bacterium RIFCSPLOW2_12_42_9]HBI25125.1 hypothetical protein [Nitrospiraceae bacterium]
MREKIIFICLLITLIISPSVSFGAFGVKLDYLIPAEENAYGQGFWDYYMEDLGGYSSGFGSPKNGLFMTNFYGNTRWPSGFGLDYGGKTPIIIYLNAKKYIDYGYDTSWEETTFTKIVWHFFYISARYNIPLSVSPYFGGGLSGYYVNAEYTSTESTSHDNQQVVPGIHGFAGIQFFHKRKVHLDLELRYEVTSDSDSTIENAIAPYNDGGNLGGLSFLIGASW